MIKFFRHIRQRLIKEHKVSKYLLYAIGEIILVVIGILIALQINNWNEENANNTKQIDYLKSIKNEMQSNLKSLNDEEQRILDVIKSKEVLIRIMSSNEAIDSITDKAIFDMYMASFNLPVLTTIETGAINEIISSGGLQFIKNDSIRKLVASWDTKSSRIKLQEINLNVTTDKIDDLLFRQKLINTRYFLSQRKNFTDRNLGAPLKEHSLKPMLRSEEFENLSIMHYGQTNFMINSIYPAYKANLHGMIHIIDEELKK
jgi:hypothetical protein